MSWVRLNYMKRQGINLSKKFSYFSSSDILGIWNNGFSCRPINNRVRTCCGPDNRRECCFVDELPRRSDSSIDSDLSLPSLNKNQPTVPISSSSYRFILIAIGFTLLLLIILLITFIYIIRRKLNESSASSSSSSSSSCSSVSSSTHKHCRPLSVTVAGSSKSSASSPVPSAYVDYWSRTIISPSEWTLAKPYNSFIGGQYNNHHNYYLDS